MLTRLDHLVILVGDLEAAVRGYERLGFALTHGGEHADGLTRNALVPFKDGSYFELVAFVDPRDPKDNVWGWRTFVPHGGGLIDYCAASDDLEADTRRLEGGGLVVDGPTEGGRRLPDGTEIRWRVARIRQRGRLLPFLIEDLTPRSLRVPGGPAADHPNGAAGISRLQLSVAGALPAARTLRALTGVPEGTPRLGSCAVSPVAPGRDDPEGRRLAAVGPGPSAVGLAGGEGARGAEELDRQLSSGVGIRLLREG